METEREKAISELNLLGVPSSEIEDTTYTYWGEYFAQNMDEILTKKLIIISHLLPDDVVNQCFEDAFEEYKNKRKQMGLDDIQKFGYSGF